MDKKRGKYGKIGKILFFLLSGVILFSPNLWAEPKVVIVSGISKEEVKSVETYAPFFKGLEVALGDIVPEYYYVGLDGAADDEARNAMGKKAAQKVEALNPDVMVAVNDNAVKYIAMHVQIPVVAGFIYGSPEALGLPTANITGVARRSFAVDIWSLTKQISGASTVSLLSKNSFSMSQIRKGLLAKVDELETMSGVRMKEMYLLDTFEAWKNQVENWTEDFIYLADVSRIKDKGELVNAAELVRWTVDNAAVPVVGANAEAVRDGALFAIVTSEDQWGKQVGGMVIKILDGTPVSEIPMETVMKGKLLINGKTAIAKNIEVPYEIINSADHIFE